MPGGDGLERLHAARHGVSLQKGMATHFSLLFLFSIWLKGQCHEINILFEGPKKRNSTVCTF